MLLLSDLYGLHGSPPIPFLPNFSSPQDTVLTPAAVGRERGRGVTLIARRRKRSVLAGTANICHPARRSFRAPPGPLRGPRAPGVLPGPPRSATRLGASSSRVAPPPPAPLPVLLQWNVTAPNSSETPLVPSSRRHSRVSVRAEFSHEPKLHHTRAPDPGGDGTREPRPTGPPFHPLVPGAPRTPRPPREGPQPPLRRGAGRGWGGRAEGSPPGPDPWAARQRGEGPRRIPGLSRPTAAPPPTLPTWP